MFRSPIFLCGSVQLALMCMLAGPVRAQVSKSAGNGIGPLACATAAVPRNMRLGGVTELIGDIVLTCTGGEPLIPGAVIPTANITVSLDTTVTNRNIKTGRVIDALLLVDEPGSGLPPVVAGFGPDAPQIPCIAGDGLTAGAGAGGCIEYA